MHQNESDKLKWDLSDLYNGIQDPQLDVDIEQLDNDVKNFSSKYCDKLSSVNHSDFLNAIKSYENISDLMGRIATFAFLYYSTDMMNQETAMFFQNIQEKLNDISVNVLFFSLQINQMSDEKIEDLLKDENIKFYRPWFRDLRSFKKHQLSDKEEALLHQTSITSTQAWHRLFDEKMVDLKFPFKDQSLNSSEIFNILSNKSEEDRRLAAKSISTVLADNIKLLTFITNILAKDKQIGDDLRKFAKPISSRNLANHIEDEVVDSLIETVKESYPNLSHRYYRLKAEWFHKSALNYWDRNAPLPDEIDKIYSWDEAKEIVFNAYDKFSPKLSGIVREFYDKRWIDVLPYNGKRDGAFAHPSVPSSHPYLLLNFMGKTRDVMTLAHEMGHGIHQYLARKQGALMCDTPLTLAETASVFGEQLTFRYLLEHENDTKSKQLLIANKVEDMLNTVVRQISFCEFERLVHHERRKGELNSERIGELWMNVQSECLGDAITLDDEYKYYWSYIPHFIHSPFYVYSYAFGDCLVNSLYQAYSDGIPDFENKYIQMLTYGGSLRHKELLDPFKLDASKKEFWKKGLNMISNFIDQLK